MIMIKLFLDLVGYVPPNIVKPLREPVRGLKRKVAIRKIKAFFRM